MKKRNTNNGSKNDDWETPSCITAWVRHNYGSYHDPCPIGGKDGLDYKKRWGKVNFINPPYNGKDKLAFVKRAMFEASQGKVCIILIPSSTETKLFHDIWNSAHRILFISPRVQFKGTNTKGEYVTNKTGQTGSMLIIMEGPRSHQPVCDILLLPKDQSGGYYS